MKPQQWFQIQMLTIVLWTYSSSSSTWMCMRGGVFEKAWMHCSSILQMRMNNQNPPLNKYFSFSFLFFLLMYIASTHLDSCNMNRHLYFVSVSLSLSHPIVVHKHASHSNKNNTSQRENWRTSHRKMVFVWFEFKYSVIFKWIFYIRRRVLYVCVRVLCVRSNICVFRWCLADSRDNLVDAII